MKEEVCSWLLAWFSTKGRNKVAASVDLLHLNYFEAGMLTSLEIVEFVTEIEERFGMQFSETDFQDARFVTVSGLADLILQHREAASGSPAVAVHGGA